jgi:hypothetical protein
MKKAVIPSSLVLHNVREFSPAGPCLSVGIFLRETEKTYFVARRGLERRVKKSTLLHTEPCTRCADHPQTVFPHGFND